MVGPPTGVAFDCNRLRLASGMLDSRCERVSPNAARCGISGECCDNDQGLKKLKNTLRPLQLISLAMEWLLLRELVRAVLVVK